MGPGASRGMSCSRGRPDAGRASPGNTGLTCQAWDSVSTHHGYIV